MRKDINLHNQASSSRHELLLLTAVENSLQRQAQQEKVNQELTQQFKEQQTQCELKFQEQEKCIQKLTEQINKFESVGKMKEIFESKIESQDIIIENQNKAIDQFEKLLVENEKNTGEKFDAVKSENLKLITNINSEMKISIKKEFDESIDAKTKQLREQIDSLNTFAERISQLHLTLSDAYVRRNWQCNTLSKKAYDGNEKVRRWKLLERELLNIDDQCVYMKNLQHAVNDYSLTVYNESYKKRLDRICSKLPENFCIDRFFKIPYELAPDNNFYISSKVFKDYNAYREDVSKNRRYTKKTLFSSYFEYPGKDCCMKIALHNPYDKVYLLHKSDETKNILIPFGENKIKVDLEYIICNSSLMFQLQKK